jgi:hypothetical protein
VPVWPVPVGAVRGGRTVEPPVAGALLPAVSLPRLVGVLPGGEVVVPPDGVAPEVVEVVEEAEDPPPLVPEPPAPPPLLPPPPLWA